MNTFTLSVMSFDKSIFQGQVVSVYFPTPSGEIGVLTNHTKYVTDTVAGTLRCTEENGTQKEIRLPHIGMFFIEDNQAKLWIVD